MHRENVHFFLQIRKLFSLVKKLFSKFPKGEIVFCLQFPSNQVSNFDLNLRRVGNTDERLVFVVP